MLADEYSFVAVFEQIDKNTVRIYFPDLPGCKDICTDYTDEKVKALLKAYEILVLHLYKMENHGEKIPEPSDISGIRLNKNETANRITAKMKTFMENITNARINYLGGLAALAPLIPFPIDIIKEKLDEDKNLRHKDDERIWNDAAGFHTTEIGRKPNKMKKIWKLYESKNITKISCADSVMILKEAARQIAALPEEEIDKLYSKRNKRYYVTFAVDSRIVVPVLAENEESAKKAAEEAFIDVNLGDAECIGREIIYMEDIYGDAKDV